MQKYALRKVVTPSEKEQLDNKQWKKDITKQSYLPTRSSSKAGESSKTILNNNIQNRNNSFKKQSKSTLNTPLYTYSSNSKPIINNNLKKNEIIIDRQKK